MPVDADASDVVPKSVDQRTSPVDSKHDNSVSLNTVFVSSVGTGAGTTMPPSVSTVAVAFDALLSGALHFRTPLCPTTAYNASATKYTVLSTASDGAP